MLIRAVYLLGLVKALTLLLPVLLVAKNTKIYIRALLKLLDLLATLAHGKLLVVVKIHSIQKTTLHTIKIQKLETYIVAMMRMLKL